MELPSPPWGGVGVGNYFSEKQEVTYPTPAPPLHGRGVAGAQGFSFLTHPKLVTTSNETATLQTEH